MANRSTELKVGITVTLAVIVLLVGVAWVGQYRLTKGGYSLTARFHDVGGLNEGDPVTVAGMERGKVERIELEPEGVLVSLWLEPDAALDADAEIAIESIGMMGEKYVAIRRGGSPRPMDTSVVQEGIYRPGLMEMMAELGEVVVVVKTEIGRLGRLLENPSGTSFAEVVQRLDRTVGELDTVIAENRNDIRSGVRDFRETSKQARELVADARTGTQATFAGVDRAVESVETATSELRDLVASLHEITGEVKEGQGTLGRLVYDKNLHDELVRTLRDLDALVEDIKENPKDYFGVSVF